MITLNLSGDAHSLEIKRGEEFIGFLQWHLNSPPKIVLWHDLESLSLSEIIVCLKRLKQCMAASGRSCPELQFLEN